MRRPHPLRSVFLLAAELQHAKMEDNADNICSYWNPGYLLCASDYSCDNVSEAAKTIRGTYDGIDREYYTRYFKPELNYYMAWWPLKNGKWDHESRILALLLCAEMLRR